MQGQLDSFRLSELTFTSLFTVAFWVNVSIWLVLLVLAVLAAAENPSSFSMNGQEAQTFSEALPVVLSMFPLMGVILSAMTALLSAEF